jgi:hypothetical protein
MKRFLRLLKWLGLALGALLVVSLLPLLGVLWECRPFSAVTPAAVPVAAAAEAQAIHSELQNHWRPEDQTYLTLPEWYIVYSTDEYAQFIQGNRPSAFPYVQAIGQYWRTYYGICRITREQYPYNSGYHQMLMVIGVSFTAENLVKGLYENTVGRLTELISSPVLSAEDEFARQFNTEYGVFMHNIPWFEFPFREKIQKLWAETPLWGPNPIRKWERRLALTLEYGVKAIYGDLLYRVTRAMFPPDELEIYAAVRGLTPALLQQEPQVQIVKEIDKGTTIAKIPRFAGFTEVVPRLAQQGVQFIEIASNDEILITAFAPSAWHYDLAQGQFLFALPIPTQPTVSRIAVKAPLSDLHLILNELSQRGVQLEHLYDY